MEIPTPEEITTIYRTYQATMLIHDDDEMMMQKIYDDYYQPPQITYKKDADHAQSDIMFQVLENGMLYTYTEPQHLTTIIMKHTT